MAEKKSLKSLQTAEFQFLNPQILMANNKGFSIIEVMITLALLVVVVISIGKVLSAIHRLYNASELKTQALAYAQEPLEIINGLKNDFFACTCATDSCNAGSPATCTRLSQTCELLEDYTSCWLEDPAGLAGQTVFKLVPIGGSWQLGALSGGPEPMTTNPFFSRTITIENVCKDANNDITDCSSGTPDFNRKKVMAEIFWTERGLSKSVKVTTIFTAWQNL